MKNRSTLDRGLLFVTLFLIGLGLVQVYSSSFIFAFEKFDDGLFFFRKQSIFVVLALMTLMIVALVPWRLLKNAGIFLFVLTACGVAATYVPGLGVKVGGAHRWLQMPMGFRIEPSEFLKVFFPIWMAYLAVQNWSDFGWIRKSLGVASIVVPMALLLGQPDFGSFAICILILLGTLFALGLSWVWVISGVSLASMGFYVLIVQVPYRMARFTAFLDPWSDPEAKGFQVIQSLLSYYSGGLTGSGLGQGQGKLFFLPEAHTDFTASVLAEETGFIGLALVLGLFGYAILKGFQISARAKNLQMQVAGLGVTLAFSLSTLFNFAVSMGLLPTKGLALPFISYGGSSLIASAFAIGVLLNIDRQSQMSQKSFKGIRIQ